jgi:hypothetical protein
MMREFRDENFEEYLKRNADNLRMRAPDRVWQKLSSELNKEKRRFGAGLSAFFLVASVLGYLTINNQSRPFRPSGQSLANQQDLPAEASASTNLERKSSKGAKVIALIPRDYGQTRQQKIGGKAIIAKLSLPVEAEQTAEESELATGSKTILSSITTPLPIKEIKTPAKTREKEIAITAAASEKAPWTIESATNFYFVKSKRKEKRFQTQYHFAPTISYRKLSENKSYLRHSSQPFAQNNYSALYNSVNSMVTHKPDIGFEFGITEKYSVSEKVRIRAGFQFNVNRYDVKAIHAPFALAAIALNNRRNLGVDSVWAIANYSNVEATGNTKASWLQNYSFQVSAPIGVELALKGNDKMQFGIAGTVQPTYVLGDRAYMITSDYKSYTHVPWLLRRWNVNTAFETFVTYQSGRTRWQVGPQVRYQLLSSFITNYPVKENLFDFGLKIGVSVIK